MSTPSAFTGWMRVKTKYKPNHGNKARRKRLNAAQVFNIIRRVVIVVAAITFISIEFEGSFKTAAVLRSEANPEMDYVDYKSNLIATYIGSGAVRDSPLVLNVLGNDTTPRNGVVYLASETEAGFQQCQNAKNSGLYEYDRLQKAYAVFALTTSYNMTLLNDIEVVAPVVDCTFEAMLAGDNSIIRVYELVRNVSNPSDVFVLGMALSLQEYRIPEQSREGPAYVGVMSVIRDMRATFVENHVFLTLDFPFLETPVFYACERIGLSADSFRILRTIPRDPITDPAITIHTGRRRGFYFKSESDQANIITMYRRIELYSPFISLTTMQWVGTPAITDSWAWVHGIHFIFGMQTLFSTSVLFVVVLRNWQQGKIWIGDAFAALSNGTLVIRLVLVLISWHVNEYWVLTEFSLANGAMLSGSHVMTFHDAFVASDMLVLMLGLISLIGWACKERVDPAFVMILFVGIHYNRLKVIEVAPAVAKYLAQYSDDEYFSGIATLPEIESTRTPLRLWTAHRLTTVDIEFLIISFFPKFVILSIVLGYIAVRKVYHRFYPDQVLQISGRSSKGNRSSSSESELVEKNHVTIFEIATGSLLRHRFGLISDYNNYVMIKGLRFASADGIYCSGYVIANGKFLVATDDVFAIALMKLLRSRLYNVYVYEVDGNSVQQTARLVYPETLSWWDLTRLNTTILS